MDVGKVGLKSASSVRQSNKTKGAGFSKNLESEDQSTTTKSVSGTIQIPALTALFDGEHKKKKNAKHLLRGSVLLDELEDLRKGIVSGSVSKTTLKHLQKTLENAPQENIEDQGLRDLILEIETRVCVELAKLGD